MTEEDEDDLDDTDQLSQSMNVTIGEWSYIVSKYLFVMSRRKNKT